MITDNYVEVRFFIGLPAEGRKISSSIALKMIFEELPKIINESLYIRNINGDSLYEHLKVAEDAQYLRGCLNSRNMIGFIANGSVLPRKSGIDERPLSDENIVKFKSPESMEVEFDLPNRGKLKGMAINRGVTLIVGGGYHGKSTVLNALQLGIYNHIPGDGREFCITVEEAVKVCASSGRYVSNVDISPFLSGIPQQLNTTSFSTLNASGSTSQAATIVESIEAGGTVLLMDEDTCAANFMIRDKRMQELIPKKDEPITSFVDCIKTIYTSRGISTLLVMGGSGDYFDVADHVIWMKEFLPYDVTPKAHLVATDFPTGRTKELLKDFSEISNRFPLGDKINPLNEFGKLRISSPDINKLIFGENTVDLSDLEQLVESTQIKGIGLAINSVLTMMDGSHTMKSIIENLSQNIYSKGIDILDEKLTGDITGFRMIDLAATLNRMRSLGTKTIGTKTVGTKKA
jgi:predicted ABC-class ATPase